MKIDSMQMNKVLLIISVVLVTSCGNSTTYLPKPKGYNRIDLPPHEYVSLPDTFPYSFEHSKYAEIQNHDSWITERYWIDVNYPDMGANIQITYKPVKNQDELVEEYMQDSYKLTNQHNVKAYAIEEKIIELPNGDYASFTELEGEVPTQLQFHVSDSTNHFLRGALYFELATANDSLAPVIEYIKEDALHMLLSLEWKD